MIATQRNVHNERLTEFLLLIRGPRIQDPNRQWCRLLFVAAWATAGCAVFADDDGEPVRYELKHVGQNDRLPGVTAAVELETWEPDIRKGIQLLVDITNHGEDAVDLYDPTDHIFISLRNLTLDPSGHSVTLPEDHVGIQLARQDRDPERRARTLAEIKARGPFHIVKDEPRRRARNVKGIDDVQGEENGVVRLEPGEHFQARLRFTQIMADPQKYWAAQNKPRRQLPPDEKTPHPPELIPPPKPVPIPAGTYQLSVFMLLNTPAIAVEERGMSSDRSTTGDPPITVQLGPKPETGE